MNIFWGCLHHLYLTYRIKKRCANDLESSRKSDIQSGMCVNYIHINSKYCWSKNKSSKQESNPWPFGSWHHTSCTYHCTIWSCLDTHQGSPLRPDSVQTLHQPWSHILTKTVQTTSGRGLNFSQNLFGLSSGLATYNWGLFWHTEPLETWQKFSIGAFKESIHPRWVHSDLFILWTMLQAPCSYIMSRKMTFPIHHKHFRHTVCTMNLVEGSNCHCCGSIHWELRPKDFLRVDIHIQTNGMESPFAYWHREVVPN